MTFASFKRGVVTHSSSPTLAPTRKASTQQSLKTFMESLNAPLSSMCKSLELPSPLTCKGSKLIHIHFVTLNAFVEVVAGGA